MVDLVGQYLKIKDQVDEAIQNVILSSAFINGPDVKNFKKELAEYFNAKHAITCGNGTDALQIALMALDLKPGDEVIVPSFTFIASAEVIAVLGLKPVFIDIDPYNYTLDADKLEPLINSKTKAIIVVHLYGQCANMDKIMSIAKNNKLKVIEDNAQAIGAECLVNGNWKKAGAIGDIGTTSFFPSKNLGAYGDGGAIITNNNTLAEKMAMIANHGSKVKYYNDMVGVNSRLDTIQAAILRIKLSRLDEYIKARQEAAAFYDMQLKNIDGIETPKRESFSTHVYHQYTIKVPSKRDELKEFLNEKGIPSMIYYPVPMHKQKPYESIGDLYHSEVLCSQVLSLPIHTELTTQQQNYICNCIKEFYN